MSPDSNQSKKSKSNNVIMAVGRRKEAVARVRLISGKGQITVNNKPISEYFPSIAQMSKYLKPFHLTGSKDLYYATVKVNGSGSESQLLAVIHGFARALDIANADYHTILKKAGLLTRDPRVKERRKYGLAQKARKGKQSPKR